MGWSPQGVAVPWRATSPAAAPTLSVRRSSADRAPVDRLLPPLAASVRTEEAHTNMPARIMPAAAVTADAEVPRKKLQTSQLTVCISLASLFDFEKTGYVSKELSLIHI